MEEKAINYSLEEMRLKRRQKLREEFSLSPSPTNRPYIISNFYQQQKTQQQRCTQNDHERNAIKNFKQQQEQPQRRKSQQKLHRISQNYPLSDEQQTQKDLFKNRLEPEQLTTKGSDITFDQYNQFTILM